MNDHSAITALQERIALYEDMKAYKELYQMFFTRLFRFSYTFVKSNEAAEEIVSDVFIKIWQMRSDLTAINHLTVYLYTITKNFSLNYITRNYKLPVVSLEDIHVETVFSAGNPEEAYISAEIIRKINEAVNELPSQCKIIFQLVKEEGLKYKDVAAILNISVLTVRNQVAIATRKIADALPAYIQASMFIKNRFSAS